MPAQLVPGGGDANFEKLPAAVGPSEILARLTAQNYPLPANPPKVSVAVAAPLHYAVLSIH
jgi:hypothetical protein